MLSSFYKSEFALVFIFSILFAALSSIPYLYGHLCTPPGKKYVGLIGWDVPGTYMYFMWQKQAAQGKNLLEDRLTPEEQKPVYFNLEWWLVGKFLRATGLSITAGFHILRCLTVLFAFLILYYFLTCFFDDALERRLVFLWIIFASGLGWIFRLVEVLSGRSWPIRIWDIEGVNLFGYLMNKPHVIRSLAMICLSYALILKGEKTQKLYYFVLAGLAVVVQGFIRPYDLPTAFLLLILFPLFLSIREGCISRTRTRNYLAALLSALPILGYYLFLRHQTLLKDVFKAVDFKAFSPLEFIIWLGFPLLIAAAGFDGLPSWRRWEKPKLFLYLWFVIVLGLIYSYPIIRWGMESAGLCYIVSPILAALFLFSKGIPAVLESRAGRWIAARFKLSATGMKAAFFGALILISLPSNVVLYGNIFRQLAAHSRPYYIPVEVADGFEWLSQNARYDDVVLSHPGNGYHLPVDAGVKAFVGHGHFTVNYRDKVKMLSRFFSAGESDSFRKVLLKEYGVDYVFYGDLERATGGFDPWRAAYLKPVFRNALVTIFAVDKERL